MADILEVAELAWRQLNPNGSDEASVTKEEYITTAQNEAAYQLWLASKMSKREDGFYDIPSYLLTEKEFEVKNNEVELCDVQVATWMGDDKWLASIGDFECDCEYVKSTLNLSRLLCDDDMRGHNNKTYYVVGNKIKFPQGVHKNPLTITYANAGENINGEIEVSDEIAALVRGRLIDLYGGKVPQSHTTNNSNPNV